DEVDLALQRRGERDVAQVVQDLLAVRGPAQAEVEDRYGHVGHRHADGAARDACLEVGQRLGDGGGGTGLGDHHVHRRRAAATVRLVVVVQQVLVVGERVDGLHV